MACYRSLIYCYRDNVCVKINRMAGLTGFLSSKIHNNSKLIFSFLVSFIRYENKKAQVK